MQTQILTLNSTTNHPVEEFIHKKINKLEKLYDRLENASIILRRTKNNHNHTEIVEIELLIPGHRLFASNESEHFEIATDLTIDELNKQLERYCD